MKQAAILQPPLRYATKADCRAIAELAEFAGEGIPTFFWSQSAAQGEQAIDVGTRNAASETENFSYKNTVVAELDGEICAMLLAYKLTDSAEDVDLDALPQLVRPLVELELQVSGTFYINMIACYPRHRGKGLGSILLEAAHALAIANHCDQLSIQVFEQNEGALRLYLRQGYRIIERRPVIPHECYPFDGDVLLLTRAVKRN